MLDECAALVGLERLGSLHLNDSMTPLGSNRDRHTNVGEGEIGMRGCAVFLSEPRFDGLPCVLETPGPHHSGPRAAEIALARTLRKRGQAARRRRRARHGGGPELAIASHRVRGASCEPYERPTTFPSARPSRSGSGW